MMTQKEARKITEEVRNEMLRKHEKDLEKFMDTTVESAVKEASEKGLAYCKFTGSYLFTTEEVADYLRKLGYSVEYSESGVYGLFTLHW